jgi:hypothetical protein
LFFGNCHNGVNQRLLLSGFSRPDCFFNFPYPFEKQDNFRFKNGLLVRADELEGNHAAAGTVPIKKNDA